MGRRKLKDFVGTRQTYRRVLIEKRNLEQAAVELNIRSPEVVNGLQPTIDETDEMVLGQETLYLNQDIFFDAGQILVDVGDGCFSLAVVQLVTKASSLFNQWRQLKVNLTTLEMNSLTKTKVLMTILQKKPISLMRISKKKTYWVGDRFKHNQGWS